jgi:ferric-dicitrate binding protein FerR (iron transport regulator)
MPVNTDRIQYLFNRYVQKACTREELQELFAYISQPENRPVLEQLMDTEYEVLQPLAAANETDWEYIFQQVTQTGENNVIPLDNRNRFRWTRVAAAAVVVLALGLGGYWFLSRFAKDKVVKKEQPVQQPGQDVQPGGNKAILKLSDGNTIVLDNAQNGLLAQQGNANIIKQNDGKLIYNREDGASGKPFTIDNSPLTYNMLATPRGGQYQLILPDGSKVWLNAASSIRYPTAFAGDERRVEITGEVYFEVEQLRNTSGQKVPFIVKINTPSGVSGQVEVLGTHFNVNAYSDEPATATTLLEGKVKVSQLAIGNSQPAKDNEFAVVLKPGEQAVMASHSPLTIHHSPDLDLAVAWKNGLTAFKSADIKSIMRQVARWYNVEVVYEGTIPQRTFTGGVSRDAKLSELLHLLEVSKVHFRIEGNKVILM